MGVWKRIGITVKPGQPDLAALLRRVAAALDERGLEFRFEPAVAAEAPDLAGACAASREEALARADLVLALGGDGTVLGVARDIGARALPILAVNLGHLGFLTAVPPSELESALDSVLRGEAQVIERARLLVESGVERGALQRDLVLNDVVFTKGTALARMIELQVRVEEQRVTTYRSDGLIVATPTGSTAYNLSAGGPLLHPGLAAIVLTPICPHTLTQRPLVLPDDQHVEVTLLSREDVAMTLDGQVVRTLRPGERVRIGRSPHSVRLVDLPGRDPFETLRTKLGWGAR
jgi:NAD+ kinase